MSFLYLEIVLTPYKGSLSSSDSSNNAALEEKHIFFTSSGRIGVIVDVLDDQLSLHLTALQRNLAGVLHGVGGVTHTRLHIWWPCFQLRLINIFADSEHHVVPEAAVMQTSLLLVSSMATFWSSSLHIWEHQNNLKGSLPVTVIQRG